MTCASDSECPSGTTCTAAGVCHRDGEPACGAADGGVDGAPTTGVFKALAVGFDFACAITADGADVVCWGANGDGALGDSSNANHARPMPIDEPGPWRALGAGTYHMCAIKESGALYCWGDASYGQVDGTQNQQMRNDPQQVEHPQSRKWISVDGGAHHTCAIDEDSVMWCWGSNEDGQLGTDAGAGVHAIAALSGNGWTDVTADERRTCALKSGGGGWCWGYGALGQTGMASQANQQSSTVPLQIEGAFLWRSLSSGLGHTCGVTVAGELMCFGEEQLGELGIASSSATPAVVQNGTDFVITFAGRRTTCATRTNPDRLICLGDNLDGQLGSGDREVSAQAYTVAGLGRVVAGGSGDGFTCVLDDTGIVSCFGRDDDGRCGDGIPDDHFIGTTVMGLPSAPEPDIVTRLAAGGDHTCALTDTGRLFCWGLNARGQIGVGDVVDHATAVEVPRPGGANWVSVSVGLAHTCAVAGTGLYCWGDDDAGQIGNGSAGRSTTPVRIDSTHLWQTASAGAGLSCAIDNNSDRWCWGENADDALGAGTGASTREDAPYMTNNGPGTWLRLELGARFGCGIASPSNELYCWGANDSRQLGQASATPATSNVPLRVESPSADWQWIAVDQLYGAVCGIRGPNTNGGNLWCWGYNTEYQLGTGDNASPQDPVEVGTERDWSRIDLGLDFACGISAVGELRCWGHNDSKQVSDADIVGIDAIPVNEILPGTHFFEVAAGWNHACALTTLDQVMCWGDGGSGQLGDGNKAHLTPYPVIAPP